MNMSKSTISLGIICLLLAVATGFAVWWLVSAPNEVIEPAVEGAFEIGLNMENDNDNRAIDADSVIVWDSEAQVIQFEENGFERHSIASITKLMTAMVALDYEVDWEKEMKILPNEYTVGGRLLMHPGETATVKHLFHASLLGSANNATLAYVRALEIPMDEFILNMNRKAIELDLEQTEFVDVTGLSSKNVSTAYEVARLAETAWRDYPIIAEITSLKEYTYVYGGSGREHTIRNTNKMISEEDVVLKGSKTGYLYEAGYCLVVQGVDKLAKKIVVVLGSPSEWGNANDTRKLLEGIVP
jgi:serine-type D-Ala-D-Ala endopeptidase (penicillin-binding protein 7)